MASLFFNSLKVDCELQIFKRENIYQVDKVSTNTAWPEQILVALAILCKGGFMGKLFVTLNNFLIDCHNLEENLTYIYRNFIDTNLHDFGCGVSF